MKQQRTTSAMLSPICIHIIMITLSNIFNFLYMSKIMLWFKHNIHFMKLGERPITKSKIQNLKPLHTTLTLTNLSPDPSWFPRLPLGGWRPSVVRRAARAGHDSSAGPFNKVPHCPFTHPYPFVWPSILEFYRSMSSVFSYCMRSVII